MACSMAASRDYYDVLGVARTSTAEEIRSAWRGLVRQFHPDVSDEPDAEARFNEVQEAYDVLSDEKKRAEYDQYGHAGPSRGGWGAGPSVDSGQFQDIFDGIFSGGGGFRPSDAASRGPRRGTDLRMELSITFRTAALGGSEQVKLKDGTSIEVKVPRGIEDGDTLRLKGRGGSGGPGGDAGDLLLTIRVGRHPALRRVGRDLFMDVPITIAEAALGATVHIALLEGSIDLKIPPGTCSGQKLRVAGRGIEDASGKQGDFYSVVQIMAPSELSDRVRSLLEDLAGELPDPREDAPGVESIQQP